MQSEERHDGSPDRAGPLASRPLIASLPRLERPF